MKLKLSLFLSLSILLFTAAAHAQAKQVVHFQKGASGATVGGTIRGYAYRDYVVGARQGQTISVKLSSKNTFTVLTVFKPGGDNLEGATEMDEFSGELPATGDYVIRVAMMRAEARRKNSVSNFSLRISVE